MKSIERLQSFITYRWTAMEVGLGVFAFEGAIYRRHSCFVASKAGLSPSTIERPEQKSRKW